MIIYIFQSQHDHFFYNQSVLSHNVKRILELTVCENTGGRQYLFVGLSHAESHPLC